VFQDTVRVTYEVMEMHVNQESCICRDTMKSNLRRR